MNRYFAYDPHGDFDTFPTLEAARKWAEEAISYHLDDGWSEEVEDVCIGEIKERATQTNVREKPERTEAMTDDEFDEAVSGFGVYDSICDYELVSLDERAENGRDAQT